MASKIETNIRKYALANAYLHHGKAQAGSVIGQLIADDPKVKSKLKDLASQIQKEVSTVNKLSLNKIEAELKKTYPKFFEKKDKVEKTLPDLESAKKDKVVMRFRPSPSGALHIGHAYVLGLNSEFCRKYNGKLIITIDDTNPNNIYREKHIFHPERIKPRLFKNKKHSFVLF